MALHGNFQYGISITPNLPWGGLNGGRGERSATFHIDFAQGKTPFSHVPNVFLTLSGLDASKNTNLRIRLTAKNVTTSGFDLVISTWDDTELFEVSGFWTAALARSFD